MEDVRQGRARGARGDSGANGAINQAHMTNGESENFGAISRGFGGGQARRGQDVHGNGEARHENRAWAAPVTPGKHGAYKEKTPAFAGCQPINPRVMKRVALDDGSPIFHISNHSFLRLY